MSTQTFGGIDWVNALKFGFIGDGETANDTKMQEYIENYSDIPLYFPKGVYCFEKSINFPDTMHLQLDPKAVLKCIAKDPIECFISLRCETKNWVKFPFYAHKSYIKGGTINANYCAKIGVGVSQGYHTQFEEFMVMNVLEKGIQTNYNTVGFHDGASAWNNIVIYNDKCMPGTYGVFDNYVDSSFTRVDVTNFETAYYTHGGRFYNCSAWNIDMSVVGTSVFANVARGHQSLFVNCSVDTYRYGFILGKTEWGYASCTVNNMTWITNKVFYGDELQAKYPRTVFVCEEPEQALFYVVSAQIPWEGNLNFSNGEMPNSIFLNMRTGGLPYLRNDTALLKDMILARPKVTTLDGATDFDTVLAPYTYECDLLTGEGGSNLPPVKEVGVLEVTAAGKMVVQKFIGKQSCARRLYDGSSWGEWIIVGA